MSSMLLAEAALIGKPVLSIIPRVSEKDWLTPIRDGHIPCASNTEEILQKLPKVIAGAMMPNRDFGMISNSGSKRVADCILEMLK